MWWWFYMEKTLIWHHVKEIMRISPWTPKKCHVLNVRRITLISYQKLPMSFKVMRKMIADFWNSVIVGLEKYMIAEKCHHLSCHNSFANINIKAATQCSQVSVKFKVQDDRDTAIISTSKWSEIHISKSLFFKHKPITWIQRCPMENCTLLVLGRSWNQQIEDLI